MLHPELCTILVLYVLTRTSYHLLQYIVWTFCVQLSVVVVGCRAFISLCKPTAIGFIAGCYTLLRQLLWKCFVEERITLTAFGRGSLVSVPLYIRLQALVFPLALELCCQNWWNNSRKAGKKPVSGSVENSSYFGWSLLQVGQGRGPRYPLMLRKCRFSA